MNGEVSTMDSGVSLLAEAMDAAKKRYLDLCTCEDYQTHEGAVKAAETRKKHGWRRESEYGWRPTGGSNSMSPMKMKMLQDKINREFGGGQASYVQAWNDPEQTGRHPGQPHGLRESALPKADEISRFHASRVGA